METQVQAKGAHEILIVASLGSTTWDTGKLPPVYLEPPIRGGGKPLSVYRDIKEVLGDSYEQEWKLELFAKGRNHQPTWFSVGTEVFVFENRPYYYRLPIENV